MATVVPVQVFISHGRVRLHGCRRLFASVKHRDVFMHVVDCFTGTSDVQPGFGTLMSLSVTVWTQLSARARKKIVDMEITNLVARSLSISLRSTSSAVRSSNLLLNSSTSAQSRHTLRNVLGPLPSLGVLPHPRPNPVLSLSKLKLLTPSALFNVS